MNKFIDFFKTKLNLNTDKNSIYASPLKRFFAGCIDAFIILIVFNIIINVASYYGFDIQMYTNEVVTVNKGTGDEKLEYIEKVNMESIYISLGISVVYYTYFLSSKKQATIGNQIFKIMVIDTKKAKVSPLTAFIRYVAFLLNNNLMGLGYLLYFFTKDHCFLQDLLSDTRVINVK